LKIAIGCDHAAFNEKTILIDYIENELSCEILDLGTDSLDSVDYPEYGHLVGQSVANNEVDKGIVLCGSGIGISIAANKVPGVRAALCTSKEHAIMSRKHNDANVLALGARFTDMRTIKKIVKAWIDTDFEGGRHLDRREKIEL
jgi:ribose 5-phosphate isomerase B